MQRFFWIEHNTERNDGVVILIDLLSLTSKMERNGKREVGGDEMYRGISSLLHTRSGRVQIS